MADAPGVDSWKEHTSAFDRVQSIATTVTQPRSAAYIADEAYVEEATAREHLDQLVDLGVLRRTHEEETWYAPDPLYTRMLSLRDLLDAYDQDGLANLQTEMRSKLEELEGRERDLLQYRLGVVEEAIEVRQRYMQAD
ncbi:DUF7342 family protein [Halopiger aswanensis]|uniref:DUF7342 family protein n=1 Tax=Halopiger aswanensis TaxID=148449 RepID=UPI000E70F57B|nr:hypothetical protein [Halopiger aswanensis]